MLTDTTKSFVAVLALQKRQDLVRELESLAAETLRSVASTVRAGAVSPVEEERARVTLERVQLEVVRSAKELDAARVWLAATWGESQARFEWVRGDLGTLPPLPALDSLLAAAPESPELARWNAEVGQREAAIAVERARRIPDVTVSLGARHYAEGAPEGWEASYISEYATMHPWEDFAETFAHYLHITGTLATAARCGLTLYAERVQTNADGDIVPRVSYADTDMEVILRDWYWLSQMFNRVNQSMGQRDLYPFAITAPVAEKLAFLHALIASRGGAG